AVPRGAGHLAQGLHQAPRSLALQPARRPVREGTECVSVRRLAGAPRLRLRARAGHRGEVPRDVQGGSDSREARELQPRRGKPKAVAFEWSGGRARRADPRATSGVAAVITAPGTKPGGT